MDITECLSSFSWPAHVVRRARMLLGPSALSAVHFARDVSNLVPRARTTAVEHEPEPALWIRRTSYNLDVMYGI